MSHRRWLRHPAVSSTAIAAMGLLLPWLIGYAGVVAKIYGFVAACLMAIPFFRGAKRQRKAGHLKGAKAKGRALKDFFDRQANHVRRRLEEWDPLDTRFMQIGLTLVALAFFIEFVLEVQNIK